MLVADAGERWTIVHRDHNDPVVRRYPVPGGWLYQVSIRPDYAYKTPGEPNDELTWHPPQFVPNLAPIHDAKARISKASKVGK